MTNFRFLTISKTNSRFLTIVKPPIKSQKDRPKTVGGVVATRYLHVIEIPDHALRTIKSRKQCPSAFRRKGRDKIASANTLIPLLYYGGLYHNLSEPQLFANM